MSKIFFALGHDKLIFCLATTPTSEEKLARQHYLCHIVRISCIFGDLKN